MFIADTMTLTLCSPWTAGRASCAPGAGRSSPASVAPTASRPDDDSTDGTMTENIAILGLGTMGTNVGRVLARHAEATVTAGVDPSERARDIFTSHVDAPVYEDVDSLPADGLAGVSGVVVATPHALHYDYAKAALEAGAHVLVEKPMVTSVDDAEDLARTAAAAEGTLSVGYQRRFHPGFSEIRRIISDGRIGAIRGFSCYVGQRWLELNADGWRTDPGLADGGLLADTGSHLLEALLWTTDLQPVEVAAVADSASTETPVSTALAVTAEHAGERVVGTLAACGESTDLYPDEDLTLWGRDGRLAFRKDGSAPAPKETLRVTRRDGPQYRTTFETGTDFSTLTRKKVRHFVDVVCGDAEPATGVELGVTLARVRTAARRAWRTGERVAVGEC